MKKEDSYPTEKELSKLRIQSLIGRRVLPDRNGPDLKYWQSKNTDNACLEFFGEYRKLYWFDNDGCETLDLRIRYTSVLRIAINYYSSGISYEARRPIERHLVGNGCEVLIQKHMSTGRCFIATFEESIIFIDIRAQSLGLKVLYPDGNTGIASDLDGIYYKEQEGNPFRIR